MIRLPNTLFFEQVEAMLAEGREVRIRMRGNSMRPLLRNGRDTVVLTPVAAYGIGPDEAAAAAKRGCGGPAPAGEGACGAAQQRVSGIGALRPGDIVLFRYRGKHVLHRIVRIERDTTPPSGGNPSPTPDNGHSAETKPDTPQAANFRPSFTDEPTDGPASTVRQHGDSGPPTPDNDHTAETKPDTPQAADALPAPLHRLRFTLAGDGNYRTTEQCAGTDICAVVTRIVRPSGRIVDPSASAWKRRSRLWLALPAPLRRVSLRVLHLLHLL